MKSLLAFACLAAVMYVCGIGEKSETPIASNTAQAPVKSTAKPDKQAVLDELVKLEKEVTEAALNGDITLLARSTTDDFELTGVDGKIQNKNQALADVKKEKNIKSFEITDAEPLRSEIVSFLDAITHGTPAPVSGADGRRALATALRVMDSIHEHVARSSVEILKEQFKRS